MAAPGLPTEIWEQIVNYLSEIQVQNLYSVNRPLLYIALNRRYSAAVIDAFAESDIRRTLLNPDVRVRTRKVVFCDKYKGLCLHPVCQAHYQKHGNLGKQPTMLKVALTKLHLLRENSQWTAPSKAETYYDQMMDVIHEVDRVREVEVFLASRQHEQYWSKLTLTDALLQASFSHISTLDLNCALEDLNHVLTDKVVLPALTTLDLALRLAIISADPMEVSSKFQLFLRNHSHSLTVLELILSHMNNASNLLLQFPKFSALSRLTLVLHTPTLYGDCHNGIKPFISLHKSLLRNLTFFMRPQPIMLLHTPAYSPETNFADLVLLNFPNLNTLTLGMLTKPIGRSFISKTYIRPYQHTLTSLQLLTHLWTYTELQRVFSGLGPVLSLKRLAIAANRLSPTLLKLVATTFPTLEELVINIMFGISSDPNDDNPDVAAPFSRDLPEVIEALRSWDPHSIALIPLSPLMEISTGLRALIVSALPCVRSFSDVIPDSYATAQRDPGVALKGRKDFWGSGFELARMDAAVAMHSNY